MRTIEFSSGIKWAVVVALLIWLVVFGMAHKAFGQTICVGVPVMPLDTSQRVTQIQQVTLITVRQHYDRVTDCGRADLELVVEPIQGVWDTGDLYLSTTTARTRGRTTGTLRVEPLTESYGGWMVTVFPRRGIHLTRQKGGNLQKVVVRAIRMGRKQHWLDGNRA